MIGKFHVTRSVIIESPDQIKSHTFEYDIPIEGSRFGTVLYVQIPSGTLLHVENDLMRSFAIGCEFGFNVCPDHDKDDYDLATIGLDRHIHSQSDYRHLLPELFQGKNYNS